VAAAYALGSIGAKNADEPLRRAMSKDNAFLQMMAAWSLAKLHPGDEPALQLAIQKLTQGLKSEDPALRTAAAKGLQMLQPPPELVAPYLIELVNDPDPEVQENIINAVASLGESVVPRLVRGLQNPELRGTAVRVLTRLGPKAAGAVQPLMEASRTADAPLRAEIHFALAAIGPAAAPATQMLAEAIGSDDQHIRESALYALRQIGPGGTGCPRAAAGKNAGRRFVRRAGLSLGLGADCARGRSRRSAGRSQTAAWSIRARRTDTARVCGGAGDLRAGSQIGRAGARALRQRGRRRRGSRGSCCYTYAD
jgi:HEAT repeat protein